ncbi:MAG: sugar transferase, partial [Opitutae bacterium]|nr:sugar transferase [Opitutae bacterium]
FDLYYIKNKSFWLDLEIILSTLRSIMKGSR